MEATAALPLAGVRVIDASSAYAGPTAAMYLADMGADVIKVERPGDGDDTRQWGPPFIGDLSAWFASANRNKRSICLDLTSPTGREVLNRMLRRAQVFLVSQNPRKLVKHGLAPAEIARSHPQLICFAISGFGLTGPDWDDPGYDLIAQARSGMMSVTGESGRPQRVSTALTDIVAGLVAAYAIAAALRRLELTGRGELIDVSLLDSALALMAPRVASYLAGDPEPQPCGATDSVLAVYQTFDTADDPIVLAVGNDAMWQRLCTVLQLREFAEADVLSDNTGRRQARTAITEAIARTLRSRGAQEWLRRLDDASIPAAPVQRLSEVVADTQVRARNAILNIGDGDGAAIEVVRAPWRLGSSPSPAADDPPPQLGEHTAEVLEEFGFSSVERETLASEGTVWGQVATRS